MEIHNHLPKRMMDIYEQWYVDNQKVKRWLFDVFVCIFRIL